MIFYLLIAMTVSLWIFGPRVRWMRGILDDGDGTLWHIGLLSLMLLSFAFFLMPMLSASLPKNHPGVAHWQPIESLGVNDNQVKGQFFLGCGSIGSETHYFYMVKVQENTYSRRSVPAWVGGQDTWIRETNDSTPGVYWTECDPNSVKINKWICPYGFIGEAERWHSRYVINVPKGTVVKDFKVQ